MRHAQARHVDDLVAIQQEVEVETSWPPPLQAQATKSAFDIQNPASNSPASRLVSNKPTALM
jgi:hypothetical protein